jgi:hypothetical protein
LATFQCANKAAHRYTHVSSITAANQTAIFSPNCYSHDATEIKSKQATVNPTISTTCISAQRSTIHSTELSAYLLSIISKVLFSNKTTFDDPIKFSFQATDWSTFTTTDTLPH